MRIYTLAILAFLVSGCNNNTGPEIQDDYGSMATACGEMISQLRPETIHPILFDYGEAGIRPDERDDLVFIAQVVGGYDCSVVIEGHADESEEDAYPISEFRARMVRSLLVESGVDPARIWEYGLGSSDPIGRLDTPEGRQLNRRVELTFSRVR
jgi:outer membrane protein OmpA-like peptidoglycan-associated protein